MKFVLSVLFSLCIADAHTCTTFLLKRGNELVFGRNYDWVTGNGIVNTNLRNIQKRSGSAGADSALTWTSQYGSITFNQYGKEFPTGGMNEKGLVVELMWLDGSQFPTPDHRPALGVLQWIQYQLDCHATVAEVIASNKSVRIQDPDAPLHYFIADSSGASATIEFIKGEMVVHTGATLQLPVLANETYTASLDAFRSGNTTRNNSHSRFAKACERVTAFHAAPSGTSAIDYAFATLEQLAQGDFTRWQIVYDINRKEIRFRTNVSRGIRSLSFSELKFDCPTLPLMLDIDDGSGDISSRMNPYDPEENLRSITRSVRESQSRIRVAGDRIARQTQLIETFKCLN